MPITAIVQKGMPKPSSGKSDSPKVSPAGWPMKESPIKHVAGSSGRKLPHKHPHDKKGPLDYDNPSPMKNKIEGMSHQQLKEAGGKAYDIHMRDHEKGAFKSSPMKKISGACKAAAKKKFDVWPSAYASGWGVRCTRAGGPGKMGKKSPAKQSKPKFTDKLFEKSERLQSKANKAASQGKNKKAARLENRVARVEKREGKRRAKYNY